MTDDLRTRIATAVWMRHRAEAFAQLGLDALAVPEQPIPNWAYGMADAVIRELTNPIRGCTDLWHWSTGKPYQCPSCGYWMGEGYV